jgi:hypothetical protein
MSEKMLKLFELAIDIARLPVARLQFYVNLNPVEVGKMHRHFTMPHPRYKIFQNKSLGAALVDLTRYRTREAYLNRMKGRNSAEQHARKARARGYTVVEIDRNEYIDEIYQVNTSLNVRQGRPIDEIYREKVTYYTPEKNYTYYGIINTDGVLMGYGNVGHYGNFSAFNRVIGVRNNDGIMHLLVSEIICQMMERQGCRYLMYDTYFGASPGLRAFKTMLGFEPYRAKYSIQ